MRHTQLTAEGGLMTVEQRTVLLYLDALREYSVSFEGRIVWRREFFADGGLAARFYAGRERLIRNRLDAGWDGRMAASRNVMVAACARRRSARCARRASSGSIPSTSASRATRARSRASASVTTSALPRPIHLARPLIW